MNMTLVGDTLKTKPKNKSTVLNNSKVISFKSFNYNLVLNKNGDVIYV